MRDLTDAEKEAILQSARVLAVAAAQGGSAEHGLPNELSQIEISGAFVSLWKGEQLRACVGNWRGDKVVELGDSLVDAAHSAVTSDQRFSPIKAGEIPQLTVEVSLLHNVEPIPSKAESVEIGKHGLVIQHPNGRGLLLPSVATERNWDAETFLENTAVKAGLPAAAWKWPDTQLTRFESLKLISDPEAT
ncbi:MAG: AmmeMemoRadiSam system protein A [Verrucomicrobiota bacterium]